MRLTHKKVSKERFENTEFAVNKSAMPLKRLNSLKGTKKKKKKKKHFSPLNQRVCLGIHNTLCNLPYQLLIDTRGKKRRDITT